MTSVERLDFDAAELMAEHSPVLRDPNKRGASATATARW